MRCGGELTRFIPSHSGVDGAQVEKFRKSRFVLQRNNEMHFNYFFRTLVEVAFRKHTPRRPPTVGRSIIIMIEFMLLWPSRVPCRTASYKELNRRIDTEEA